MARSLPCSLLIAALFLALVAPSVAAADPGSGEAIGTIQYEGRTVTLKHAYLIAGDNFGSKVRKVILSAVDIGDRIAAADSLSSASGKLREGIAFEFDETLPFVGYWMAIDDQSVQVSAPIDRAVFTTTTSTADRIVGKVAFDKSGAGGPRVEVSFDAALLKEF